MQSFPPTESGQAGGDRRKRENIERITIDESSTRVIKIKMNSVNFDKHNRIQPVGFRTIDTSVIAQRTRKKRKQDNNNEEFDPGSG